MLKAKQDRFISAYVKTKDPRLFMEAKDYYKQLDSIYPHKRDLCKTVEFLHMSTGVSSFSQYYYKRKQEKQDKEKQDKEKITDNMVLRIPLMSDIPDQQTQQEEVNVIECPVPDKVYEGPDQQTQQEEVNVIECPLPDNVYEGVFCKN